MLTAHLDRTTARAVISLANRAPSVHNSQPWRWRIGPSSIHLFADPERALPATDPEGRDLRLSCGAALHHLRVALLAAGMGARVHRLPDPAHPLHLAALEPHPDQPTPDDLARARAIENRRSDRRVFSTWPVPAGDARRPAGRRRPAGSAAEDPGPRVRPGRRRPAGRARRRRAGADPGHVRGDGGLERPGRGAREGVPAANVPAEPAGTMPMRHFAGSRAAAEPAGSGRDRRNGVRAARHARRRRRGPVAGRRGAERRPAGGHARSAWPPTRSASRWRCAPRGPSSASPLLDGAAEPQVLLRLGWAPMSATPVPQTGRRPVTDTIDAMDLPWD